MDILTEMQEQHKDPDALAAAIPEVATERDEARQAAELALKDHLAMEGELAFRRDHLQAEHQAVSQRLAQARELRQGLVEAVRAAGGSLPSWNL